VFPSLSGTPLNPENLRRDVIRPARGGRRAVGGLPHLPAHLRGDPLRGGFNVKQVQKWLGHHSPSFTLDTYVHLLDERLPEPVSLRVELAEGGNGMGTSAPSGRVRSGDAMEVETAL
jgi:integrase